MQINKWTVLIYQGAANNLEPNLKKNVTELAQLPLSDEVDVFVRQVDRQGIQRDYVVENGEARLIGTPAPGVNSADPASLTEFLRQGIQKYPAQHYVVVLSSHGRGAEGVIEDERSASMMSLPQLRGALEGARQANGGVPLDAVVFDACRMMATEAVCELHGVAQVAVGSIDRVGARGLDPSVLLSATANTDNGYELARRLVSDVSERQWETFGALSAVDLNRTPELQNSMAELSAQLQALPPDAAARVRGVISACRRSLPSPMYLQGLECMAEGILANPQSAKQDLQDWLEESRPTEPVAVLEMAQKLASDPHQGLAQAAQAVVAAHNGAVFARREEPAGGLTVTFPVQRETASDAPAHLFERATQWSKAVSHVVPTGTPSLCPPTWLEQELSGMTGL